MPTRQSGSPRQQCIGVISAIFVDSIDSQIILWVSQKHHLDEWFSKSVDLLYFGYLVDVRFLKPVF